MCNDWVASQLQWLIQRVEDLRQLRYTMVALGRAAPYRGTAHQSMLNQNPTSTETTERGVHHGASDGVTTICIVVDGRMLPSAVTPCRGATMIVMLSGS